MRHMLLKKPTASSIAQHRLQKAGTASTRKKGQGKKNEVDVNSDDYYEEEEESDEEEEDEEGSSYLDETS